MNEKTSNSNQQGTHRTDTQQPISAAHRHWVARCYQQFYPRILAKVCAYCPQEASEITSDVFYKLLKLDYASVPQQDKHLENYLMRMAVNQCIDRYKQLKHRQFLLDNSGLFHQHTYRSTTTDHHMDLATMLAILNPAQKNCMELWCLGLSYDEIAQQLTVTTSAVKHRISRARQKIRDQFTYD